MELYQPLNAQLLPSKRLVGFFHWVEQLHRRHYLRKAAITVLVASPRRSWSHPAGSTGCCSPSSGLRKSLDKKLPEKPSLAALLQPRVTPAAPAVPSTPTAPSAAPPANSPLFQPRGSSALPHTALTPSPPSALRSPSAAHRPGPASPHPAAASGPGEPSTALRRLSPLRGAGGSRAGTGIGNRSGPAQARTAAPLPPPLMAPQPSASARSLPLPAGPAGDAGCCSLRRMAGLGRRRLRSAPVWMGGAPRSGRHGRPQPEPHRGSCPAL